jgi:hypothetical protein
MKAKCKTIARIVALYVVLYLSLPFVGGLYYEATGDHSVEQAYLDRCIAHLKELRAVCGDPDLQGVLDYTIQRYNKIGAWDVMFIPAPALPRLDLTTDKAIGVNCPWCPGVSLDTCLLRAWPEDTAIILAHEALHDYWPFFGHGHINDREVKLYALSTKAQQRRHHQ